jgi:hypothetical protein
MSFIRVPPDSTGKRVYTKEQTVSGETLQVQAVHLADTNNPENFLRVDERGAAFIRFAEGQATMSGFGSLKVAQERALGVYESSLDEYRDLFTVEETGGGQLSYAPEESSEVLSVTGSSGDAVKMTTNRYHYYLPGASNLIKMTSAVGDIGKAGNKRSWGYYDDNDGLFFELDNNILYVVIRSSTTGSVVNTRVAQTNWNSDKLDGTGISDVNIDITKVQIWWIEFQWLGAGRVRFGIFGASGERIVCHQFNNAGANALPYMRTGTLPIRFENYNTSATGSSSEMRVVCAAVYVEGTYEDYTFWRFSDINVANKVVTSNSDLFSIRLKNQVQGKHNSVVIFPETLEVFTTGPVAITLWENTTVVDGTWESLASVGEVNYSGTINAAPIESFKTIYCNTGVTSINLSKYFEINDEGILINADGTPRVWAATASVLSGASATVSLNMNYRELW